MNISINSCEELERILPPRITHTAYNIEINDCGKINEKLLGDSNDYIYDESINFWLQELRKEYYQKIDGLDHTYNFDLNSCFDEQIYMPKYNGIFANVINVNSNHWICVSNFKAAQNTLHIYDSLPTFDKKNIRCHSVRQILERLQPDCKTVVIKKVTQQKKYNCALFSLAFVHLICIGIDPTHVEIEEAKLRSHFNFCIQNKKYTMFPYKMKSRIFKDVHIINLN